jgi:hypothetical protein
MAFVPTGLIGVTAPGKLRPEALCFDGGLRCFAVTAGVALFRLRLHHRQVSQTVLWGATCGSPCMPVSTGIFPTFRW